MDSQYSDSGHLYFSQPYWQTDHAHTANSTAWIQSSCAAEEIDTNSALPLINADFEWRDSNFSSGHQTSNTEYCTRIHKDDMGFGELISQDSDRGCLNNLNVYYEPRSSLPFELSSRLFGHESEFPLLDTMNTREPKSSNPSPERRLPMLAPYPYESNNVPSRISRSRESEKAASADKRLYPCKYCDKAFGKKGDIYRHEASVHRDRMMDPPEIWCQESHCLRKRPFSRRDNYNDHLRRVHSIDIPKYRRSI